VSVSAAVSCVPLGASVHTTVHTTSLRQLCLRLVSVDLVCCAAMPQFRCAGNQQRGMGECYAHGSRLGVVSAIVKYRVVQCYEAGSARGIEALRWDPRNDARVACALYCSTSVSVYDLNAATPTPVLSLVAGDAVAGVGGTDVLFTDGGSSSLSHSGSVRSFPRVC
jgi:hypothetical protein